MGWREWGGGGGSGAIPNATLQNDFCLEMGSDESHFNVSSICEERNHKTVSILKPQLLKRKENRSGESN